MLLRFRNRAQLTQRDIELAVARRQLGNDRPRDTETPDSAPRSANHNQLDRIIVRVADSRLRAGGGRHRRGGCSRAGTTRWWTSRSRCPSCCSRQEQRTKTIFNVVLGAIASISLIVGGIGIMNIMLASVLERIREIGVRRAIGATQQDILFQFLSEAVLISVAGGVAGIIVGAGLSVGIERFAGIQTIVSLAVRVAWRSACPSPSASCSASCRRTAPPSRTRSSASATSEPMPTIRSASAACSAPRPRRGPAARRPAAAHAPGGDRPGPATGPPGRRRPAQTLDAARARNRAFWLAAAAAALARRHGAQLQPLHRPGGPARRLTLFTPQQQTTSQLGVTVSQQLPFTGGNLIVSSSLQRFEMTGAQQVRTWSSTPITVSLQQDILRPNTAQWDRRGAGSAHRDRPSASTSRRGRTSRCRPPALFFDVYAAQVAEANAAHNAAVNDTLYTLNKGRFEVGKIGENDLLQSELALLRARTSLDGARLDFDRALAAFRLALNVPADTAVTIAVTSDVPKVELDTTLAVTEALRNSSAIAGLALQDVQARRRVTRGTSWPRESGPACRRASGSTPAASGPSLGVPEPAPGAAVLAGRAGTAGAVGRPLGRRPGRPGRSGSRGRHIARRCGSRPSRTPSSRR